MKDPTIKLFGKRIPLLADGEISGEESVGISGFGGGGGGAAAAATDADVEEMNTSDFDHPSITGSSEKKEEMQRVSTVQQKEEKDSQAIEGGLTNQETCPESINENPKTPSMDEETERVETCETENHQQSETMTDSQDKQTLKKPDKIIPCPRCNSMDTKFCYYNNYNVSQPRHFCKSCQRYWTAGGTMRNVPVGAGRRKNKNCGSSQQYRHITISEALEASRTDAQNGAVVKCNGTVVSFGIPDGKALSDSMASVLNLTEKNTLWNGGTQIGFHKIEDLKMQVPCRVGENGDDHSSGASSLTTEEVGSRSCVPQQEPFMPNFNGFLPPQIQCLPAGVPWPYQWNSSAVPPPHAFYSHPGFPFSFYPPAGYWNNCTIPGTWNVPWMPPTPSPSSSSPANQKAAINPGSNSSTLGKHSRDDAVRETDNSERLEPEAEPTRQRNSERCIWVPKTLRIDDPEEAAKSSIWATLGIKNDSIISSKGGIFKAFQPKCNNEKNHHVAGADETSPALRANPAALSRSLNFHESS